MMNIYPGEINRNWQRRQYRKVKTDRTMLVALVLFGVFVGYILGLWQQIAQKQHRETCAACRSWNE